MWCNIIGNRLIGTIELPKRLNADSYLKFVEKTLEELLEDLHLEISQNMCYQHDGDWSTSREK